MTPQAAVGAGLGGLAAAGAGGTGIAYAAGAFEKPKEPDKETAQDASGGTTQTEQAGSRGTAGVSQEKAKEGVGSPEAPVGSGSNIVVQPESARGE
uniref:hypothetical protein n=1 Tax=Candidatus Mycoplasma haematohominis TaxID=1494318 RepID=UPI001C0A7726